MPKKRSYTDEELREAVAQNKSWGNVLLALGLKIGGGSYSHIQKVAKDLNIDSSHFPGSAWNKKPWNTNTRPIEVYLNNEFDIHSHRLKKRLWKEGFKEKCCEMPGCGITEWHGKPAPLELDHIDGDRFNNNLENLRILCPNCHALTETYCGKNIAKSLSRLKNKSDSNE